MIDTIRTLAIAWKSLTAYPPGHPALATSLATAYRNIQDATAGGTVTLGVARDGLVHGDEKLASTHAQGLAAALYRREVTFISFDPGIQAGELESFFRLLALDPAGAARPPLAEEIASAGIGHIRLETLDYSALRVTESLDAQTERPPDLWDDLLRALLQGRQLDPEGQQLFAQAKAASTSEIACFLMDLIKQGEAGGSGDEVAIGAAGHSGGGEAAGAPAPGPSSRLGAAAAAHIGPLLGVEKSHALHQVLELLRALPEDVRGGLLEAAVRASASDEESAEILGALASLAPNAVLQILHRLSEQGEALSAHALRLVRALSAAAEPAAATSEADRDSFVAEIESLYSTEDIDRYNPEDHEALLERIAVDIPLAPPDIPTPPEMEDRLATLADEAVADHLTHTVLELLRRRGPLEGYEALLVQVESLFRVYVAQARLEDAIAIVETLREIERDPRFAGKPAIRDCFSRLGSGESVSALIESLHQPSVRAAGLAQRLIEVLGAAAARSFLFALAEETDQSRRRRLFDLLAAVGAPIVPAATELLSDDRWFVLRNMILLLRKVGDRASVPELRRLSSHPDLRVRLEAIKSLLAFDPTVPQDLLAHAIHDPDPKLAEAAVSLAGTYGIKEAVDPIVSILERLDLLGRQRNLRLKCLRALGELADPAALARIGRFFRPSLLPLLALEERRAAFKSLESYPIEARRPLVEAGLRSRDAEIRDICQRFAQQATQPVPRGDADTPSGAAGKDLPE